MRDISSYRYSRGFSVHGLATDSGLFTVCSIQHLFPAGCPIHVECVSCVLCKCKISCSLSIDIRNTSSPCIQGNT